MGSTKALRAAPHARPRRPLERERIIADALVDVASELRLTDPAELIFMIRNDNAANIADLVNSSTELFFRSGTLRYALSASFKAPWDATPVVAIDMEFRHGMVSAFFKLTIGQRRAGVEIIDILFDERGLDERAKARAPACRLGERADASELAKILYADSFPLKPSALALRRRASLSENIRGP